MKDKTIKNKAAAGTRTVAAETFEDLLPGYFEVSDAAERRIFKQSMVAAVLIRARYDFGSMSKDEFFGLPLFTESSDEVINKWKNWSWDYTSDYAFEKLAGREKAIRVEIVMLLAVIFADLFYLLKANGCDCEAARSEKMKSFFQKLIRLDENKVLYAKITGLKKLITSIDISAEEKLEEDYFVQVDALVEILEEPFLTATMEDIAKLFRRGMTVSETEMILLCRANIERLHGRPRIF